MKFLFANLFANVMNVVNKSFQRRHVLFLNNLDALYTNSALFQLLDCEQFGEVEPQLDCAINPTKEVQFNNISKEIFC